MSYINMPALPLSMAKGLKKSPVFNTAVQKTQANRANAAASFTPFATWAFEFDLDKITGHEQAAASVIAQFLGTFMACQGRGQLFTFTDPQDSAVTYANSGMLNVTPGAATPMGTAGDGTSTVFQVARSIGGLAWDVIQAFNGSILVKVNGSIVTPASVDDTGVVTFSIAPGMGDTITWQGSFFYLCRFEEDVVDAVRAFTMNSGTDQWDVSSIKFASEFV